MTNKTFKRFALSLTIVLATMLLVVSGTQKVSVGHVSADTNPITTNGLLTTMEYGTTAYEYFDSIIGSYSSESDKAADYYGKISGYVYGADGKTLWWVTFDNSKIPGASGYDEFAAGTAGYILDPGTYVMDIEWSSSGTYAHGSLEDVELTVTPRKINLTTELSEYNFYNCYYGYYDYWSFVSDAHDVTDLVGDDEAYMAWFYADGEDDIALSDTTNAGAYSVYPKLVGEHADKYVTDGYIQYRYVPEGGMGEVWQDITRESPVDVVIKPQEIMVYIAYDNGDPSPAPLSMYEDGDWALVMNNDLYYNVTALPLIGYTNIPDLQVNMKEDCWYWQTGKKAVNEVQELGVYFITTEDLYLTSDIEGFANNFKIVNSNCKITVNKRLFYVSTPTEEYFYDWYSNSSYSKDHEKSFGFYTGSEVIPQYEVYASTTFWGEYSSNIIFPDIIINHNSTLKTEVSTDKYDTGNIILEIEDDGTHFAFNTSSLTYSWDYIVIPGYADIEIEKVQNWYYQQVITDYSKKINVTLSSTDETETITLKEIRWSIDGGFTFNSGFPTKGDVANVGGVVTLQVLTNEVDNKFNVSQLTISLDIDKAPVFIRSNTILTYNGEYQEPELEDYLLYIYEPDVEANLWHNVFDCASTDYTKIINYYERGGEWVPHLMTSSNKNVGTYEMNLSLIQGKGYMNNAYDNSVHEFQDLYELVHYSVDAKCSYRIIKKTLMTDEATMQYYTPVAYDAFKKQYSATYGDTVYAPMPWGVTGFVGYDTESNLTNDTDHTIKHIYYTTVRTPMDSDWIETDMDLTDLINNPRNDAYSVKYVCEYQNYENVEMTYKFLVRRKVVLIKWYESEEAYNLGAEGIETENDITLVVATYAYNGNVQVPYYVISGAVNGDETPAITNTFISDNKTYWSADGITVGEYRYSLKELDNDKYALPLYYDTCDAVYKIVKATLTITPDDGFSKVYGTEEDPVFTYTVEGAVNGETPEIKGALSRVAGIYVDNYNITLGTVALTDATVNDNYEIVLNATPVTFAITQREIEATFTNLSQTYTGKPIVPVKDTFLNIVKGDESYVDINLLGGNTIDAGKWTKSFELVGARSGNYTLKYTSVEYTINTLTVVYTGKIDGEAVNGVKFDSTTHTFTVAMNNAVAGDDVAIEVTGNTEGTSAATYVATLTLTGNKAFNYVFDNGNRTTTHNWYIYKGEVNPSTITDHFTNTVVEYDGKWHTVSYDNAAITGYTAEYYFYGTSDLYTGRTNVGTDDVEVRFTPDSDHNPIDAKRVTVKVEPKKVTINVVKSTFDYDGQGHLPVVTLGGIIADDEGYVTEVWSTGHITNATDGTDVNIVSLTGSRAGNYVLPDSTSFTLKIKKVDLTVSAVSKVITYGDAKPTFTVSISGFVNGETENVLTGEAEFHCDYKKNDPVNTYLITVDGLEATNYNIKFTKGNLTVEPKQITVTYTSQHKEVVYGNENGFLTVNTEMSSNSYYLTADFVGRDTVENSLNVKYNTQADGKGSIVASLNRLTNAGRYYIVATADNDNYDFTFDLGDEAYVLVAPKSLVVYANPVQVTYGDVKPEFTVGYNGFVNDQNETVLEGTLEFDCEYEQFSDVGNYDIIPSGLSNNNYDITFTKANLSVRAKAITLTIVDKTSVYGSAQVTLEARDLENAIVNNDVVDYTLTCEVTEKSVVGTYDIIGADNDDNYIITFANQEDSYTVTPKGLTITAENKQVTYGDAIPTFTVAYDGWVNGENETTENVFGGELAYACEYTNTSVVGTYTITPSGLTSANYAITFNDGTLEVQKKAITISYNNDHKVVTYGDATVWNNLGDEMQANSFYLVTNEGWVGHDTVENSLYYSMNTKADGTGVDVSENLDPTLAVGTYYLVVTGRNTANYDFTIVLGDEAYLNVTKKSLTITAENKNITYGDAIPAYTVEYKGFVNDETPEVLGGELAYACEYAQFKAIGNYTITPSGLTSGNYEITFVDGTVTVAKKAIIITIDNKDSVYGDAVKATTATVPENAIVNNDDVYNLSCEVTVRSHVGSYVISGTSTNDNYEVQFVNGTYRVTPRELELIWSDLQFVYDQLAHKPSVTAENKANGDIVLLAVSGEQVVAGSHTATASIVDNNDYVLPENHSCPFTITKPTTFTYNKPLTTEQVANEGVDLTEVFNNMDTTASNTTFTLKVGESLVTFNKTAITQIAGKENVVMKFELLDGEKATEINKNAVAVLEVSLSGIPFDEGSITITCPFENKAPGGKEARLYFIDENGKKTKVDATFTGETVEFTPPHFSTYAVMYKLTALSIVLIILGILIVVGGGLAAVYFFVIKKAPVVETAGAGTNQILEDAEASNSEAEDNAETEDDTEESEDTEDTDTDQE